MTYKRGQEVTVSMKVSLRDRSQGMPGTLAPYDFINAGGYTPTPVTGTACSDLTKGKLTFFMTPTDGSGNAVQINILGAPTDATDVPLRLYVAADAFEPYFYHNGPINAGTYRCRTVFTFANMGDEIIDEWTETWT